MDERTEDLLVALGAAGIGLVWMVGILMMALFMSF